MKTFSTSELATTVFYALTRRFSNTILQSMNSTYSITSKFQVTIPKELREVLGISSNDRVRFIAIDKQLIIERVPSMQEAAEKLGNELRQRGIKPATTEAIKNARHTFHAKGLKWE